MGNQTVGQNPFSPFKEDQAVPPTISSGIVSRAINPTSGFAGGNVANPTGMMSAEQFRNSDRPVSRPFPGIVRGMLEDKGVPDNPVTPQTPTPTDPNIVPTGPSAMTSNVKQRQRGF